MKKFKDCDDCGRKMKTSHFYKTKTLCNICHRKRLTIIPSKLTEPVSMAAAFTLRLTKTQKKMLNERVKFLFPKMNNCRTKYLKALILGDLEHWESEMKESE